MAHELSHTTLIILNILNDLNDLDKILLWNRCSYKRIIRICDQKIIKIYGNKLYAVINVSNFIEVMDARTAKHLGTIPLENGRYITFANGKAYASSYAGPVTIDPKAPLGKVVEIDTINLSVTRQVTVGYQPEELEVVGNNLYVANSGGYRVPEYDKTVSVIDLSTFKETKKIDVEQGERRFRVKY